MFVFCTIFNIILLSVVFEVIEYKLKIIDEDWERYFVYAVMCLFSAFGPLTTGLLGVMFVIFCVKNVAEWIANQIKKRVK